MKILLTLMILGLSLKAQAELIVIEDFGGVSAQPYYQALNLLPEKQPSPLSSLPAIPLKPYSEADMLPVKSARLTPGQVTSRTLKAPGLQPLFLIGDDALSRSWLTQRGDVLRQLNAVGLVVNVERPSALQELRQLANGLHLAPVSGDQLAEMIGLEHYPVLITATGLEQ
ncbi:integrating conjugative element protein [Pseudomonas capsici]|uniref:integrating conjugative element protein n=1 Tax=Pseudomonas capsici TaxID=2810614 RepID=UPI0021F1E8E3|nr:integrating conjugative element protein [Pseudomonas capsici]MCV4286441.1 integrating conjugative element protein [Pseudomonas capsici]